MLWTMFLRFQTPKVRAGKLSSCKRIKATPKSLDILGFSGIASSNKRAKNSRKRAGFPAFFARSTPCREKGKVQKTLEFTGLFGGEDGIRTHVRLLAN